MSLSRRARRGIAVFNKIQTSPNRLPYMMKKLMIEAPKLDANILNAAQSAVEALNASVQILPQVENNAVAPVEEGRAEHGITVQPETGESAPESSAGGPQ